MTDSVASSEHQQGRSCPCKRLPLLLSSFTAAEHGNLHALQRHAAASRSRSSVQQDAHGNTPLHLAAQHGHVEATYMLLQNGVPADAGSSGATALHRACFSGAVACVQLLLLQKQPTTTPTTTSYCDMMLRPDTSFGDCMTPLHKAASGGRYLVVQLLLETLAQRTGLLEQAASLKDSRGMTPLQVAQERYGRQMEEQQSVARWDVVAGGPADWGKCVQLLEAAVANEKQIVTAGAAANVVTTQQPPPPPRPNNKNNNLTLRRPVLPPPNFAALSQEADCIDCDENNGRCLTSSWENAFRAALSVSVDGASGAADPTTLKQKPSQAPLTTTTAAASDHNVKSSSVVQQQQSPTIQNPTMQNVALPTLLPPTANVLGQSCAHCNTNTIVLYTNKHDGQLVCKRCRRLKR